jgi:hypothetical protein
MGLIMSCLAGSGIFCHHTSVSVGMCRDQPKTRLTRSVFQASFAIICLFLFACAGTSEKTVCLGCLRSAAHISLLCPQLELSLLHFHNHKLTHLLLSSTATNILLVTSFSLSYRPMPSKWMDKPCDQFWAFTKILVERTDSKCYIVRLEGLSGNHKPLPFSEAIREHIVDKTRLEEQWAKRKRELGVWSRLFHLI